MPQKLDRIPTPESLDALEELVAAGRPVLFAHPEPDSQLLRAGRENPEELLGILRARAGERKVASAEIGPEYAGRLTHSDKAGLAAAWSPVARPLAEVIDEMLASRPDGTRLLVKGAPIDEVLPELDTLTRLSVRPEVPGRLWLGNASGEDVHFDQFHSLSWLFLGRQRIWLFTPEELAELRPGPLEGSHLGAPLSLFDPAAPPDARTQAAVDRSLVVDLVVGDVLFVPTYWWHGFSADEAFGMVRHFWSDLDARRMKGAMAAVWQGLLALRELPEPHRAHFERLFDVFVFAKGGDPYGHLAPADQGAAGEPSDERRVELRRRALAEGRRLAYEALDDTRRS
ncbi:MAG: cupin-like domain-containing protein [Deltaproteobacteria bacterium]